jgi:hypothetical protein
MELPSIAVGQLEKVNRMRFGFVMLCGGIHCLTDYSIIRAWQRAFQELQICSSV